MKTPGLLSSAFCLSGQTLLVNLLSIPATAFIIRRLGPAAYGQWALATALIVAVTLLTNLGLRTAFVRRLAQRPECTEDELAVQLGLRILLSVGSGLLAVGICLVFRYPAVVIGCTAVSALGLMLTVQSTTLNDVQQARQCLKSVAAINLGAGLAVTTISVVTVYFYPTAVALSLAYLTGPAVSFALSWLCLRRLNISLRMRFDRSRYREMLRETRALGYQSIALMVFTRAVDVMTSKLLGFVNYGLFSAGSLPVTRLECLPDHLATAFYPTISRGWNESPAAAARDAGRLLHIVFVLCLPLALLVSYLADPIASILFARGAEQCRDIIRITIWALPLNGITLALRCALEAKGEYSRTAYRTIWAMGCGTLLSLGLILKWGWIGAAWSVLLTRGGVTVVFLLPWFIHCYPQVLPKIPIVRIAGAGSVMAGVLLLSGLSGFSGLPGVMLTGALAMSVYIVGLFCFRVFEVEQLLRVLRVSGRMKQW